MKLIVAAAMALNFCAAAAHAESEGGRDPFAFQAPGLTMAVPSYVADTGSAAYPNFAGHASKVTTAGESNVLPATGNEVIVQAANSLPRGFEDGTVTMSQTRSVQNFLARHATAPRVARTERAPNAAPHG